MKKKLLALFLSVQMLASVMAPGFYATVSSASKAKEEPPVAEEQAESEPSEECEEPEVEVELIFNENDENDENDEADEEPVDEPIEKVIEEPVAEPVAELPITPIVEAEPIVEPEPTPAPAVEDEYPILTPKTQQRSAILSLYDDEPQPVLGEQFASEQPSVADTIAPLKGVAESAPLESLRSAIGVADRFMLIRELFDGDAESYNSAIDALDAQPTFDDCLIYIAEHYSWRADREGTKFMMELLQRKFN
jgi:hypothetical protein